MPLLKYSLLRLLVLGACVGVLYWVVNGWLLLLLAVVMAGLISYVTLGKQRDASALYLAHRAERREAGINSPGTDDADEDREVEESGG